MSANPRTILSLADLRSIDLVNPTAADYAPLSWAAEHLAKENRYNGATPGLCYSVAQHLVEGCRAIIEESQDPIIAAYFSLHDVPEAVLKDDTTPKKHAIAAIAEQRFGVLAPAVLVAFDELTERHDRAIHEAAGLAWPPPRAIAAAVKHFDRVMLLTEWRDFMPGAFLPNREAYAGVLPLRRRLHALPHWSRAADQLVDLWCELLPNGKALTP